MIKDLLQLATKDVPLNQVSHRILYFSEESSLLLTYLQKNDLRGYLKAIRISHDIVLDPLSLPDLIWGGINSRDISIGCYPLGEVIERSWKKSIIWLLNHYFICYEGLSDAQIHNFNFDNVKYVGVEPINIQEMVRRFLSNLLFELCMISLRSKAGKNADLGYAFQFKDGHLVTLEDQVVLRKKIEAECEGLSARFIPYFLRSLDETRVSRKIRIISEGIQEIFPFIEWLPDTHKRHKETVINVIVGTAQLSNLANDYEIDHRHVRIILDGKAKNVAFDLSDVERFVNHPLHSLTKDLLEIIFVVYIADLYVPRNQNLSRSLNILMPVRHKEIWTREASRLQRVVSFLARDNVTFHFTQKKGRRERSIEFNISDDNRQCTCLFSGGIDSAVGSVWAIDKGYTPTLVSYSPGNLSGIQSRLLREIESSTNTDLPYLNISWQSSKKKRGRYRLGSPSGSMLFQHLRSFFYVGLAFSVAIELGHKKVYVFENGPIAINPLLSESHINTRTAHPVFLESYLSIVRAVFGINISIVNPFIYNTKGQLVSYVRNKGTATKLIPNTSSCFSYARVRAYAKLWFDDPNYIGTHDGDCLPCIVRRISLHQAKLAAKYDEHLIDVFNLFESPIFLTMPGHSIEILVRIADLLRFHEAIKVLPPYDRILLFPDIYPYSENLDCAKITDMYKRYAHEVLACFRDKSDPTLFEAIKHVLLAEVEYDE